MAEPPTTTDIGRAQAARRDEEAAGVPRGNRQGEQGAEDSDWPVARRAGHVRRTAQSGTRGDRRQGPSTSKC
jgi:hypothetical protein